MWRARHNPSRDISNHGHQDTNAGGRANQHTSANDTSLSDTDSAAQRNAEADSNSNTCPDADSYTNFNSDADTDSDACTAYSVLFRGPRLRHSALDSEVPGYLGRTGYRLRMGLR